MHATFHTSIAEIDPLDWNALWPGDYPFTRHEFLLALEDSNSVDTGDRDQRGWRVNHLCLHANNRLVGGMPLFIKMHSYGEYVFDWSWAQAYHQAGLEYYPKLVNAIPFTPATGPRLAVDSALTAAQAEAAQQAMITAVKTFAQQHGCTGFHCLFPHKSHNTCLQNAQLLRRLDCQFHWFNDGYQNFDDFLSTFSSRKRKNINKERTKLLDSGLTITMRAAKDIDRAEWARFYTLYQSTYLKKSGHGGYLSAGFFEQIARSLPEQVLLASAHHQGEMIAAAFYLRDHHTLYGRYWGTVHELDGLHFECCYYQGIDYAISHQLQRFDPGAQGEHKIKRGFIPVLTQSYHWLEHPTFANAVGHFVQQEQQDIRRYVEQARSALPFKQDTDNVAATELIEETE